MRGASTSGSAPSAALQDAQVPGFEITSGKGFHITFANGWTASVQWGPYNYCEKYRLRERGTDDGSHSPDAEVAAWDADGKWYQPGSWGDSVKGYMSPADVLAFLNRIAKKP